MRLMPLSPERISHYEDKKSEIMFSALSDKIRLTRDLIEDLITCPKDHFIDILNTKVQAIDASVTPEARERFTQLQHVEKEIEQIEARSSESAEDVEAEMKALEPLYTQREKLYKEDKRRELSFLENIHVLQRNLIQKFEQAETFGSGDTLRKSMHEFLQKQTPGLAPEDIAEVERDTAFTVRATIVANAMEKHFARSLGIFFGGSPVFIVKESSTRDITTENHERLHTVTEGLLRGHPSRHVRNVLELAERMYPIMGDRIFTTLAQKIPGKHIVDGLHGEIVSALEQAFESNFGAEAPTTGAEAFLHLFGIKKGGPDRFVRAFETAGVETVEILNTFSDFKKRHMNETKLVAWVESMEKELAREFRNMARGIESTND